MLLMTMVNQ